MENSAINPTPQPHDLDAIDRRLLDALQQGVPLVVRPFQELAGPLGVTEQDVLDRLRRIARQGLISRISAIFDTRSLGYESVLVAAKYRPEDVDRAAQIINEHPGVSHNYLRTAEYNLWYTLAVPPDSHFGLEKTAAILSELSGAIRYRLLPAERVYKIGVRLALSEEDADAVPAVSGEKSPTAAEPSCRSGRTNLVITPAIKSAILALQEDLPIEPQPFETVAGRHGLDMYHVLAAAKDLQEAGVMRRYGAVLRHRRVGFAVNCMTVWNVPADRAEQVGMILASFAEVTHCYLRPTWSDWPYGLYAMIHCRSQQQCDDLVERMKGTTGIRDVLAVFSTKEYKKVRLQYFSPAFAAWEQGQEGSRGA